GDRARYGRRRVGADAVCVAERNRRGKDRALGPAQRAGAAEDRVAAELLVGEGIRGSAGAKPVLVDDARDVGKTVDRRGGAGIGGGAAGSGPGGGVVARRGARG